jgi:flagellar biosynthesis/type III secretory pathway chaperone
MYDTIPLRTIESAYEGFEATALLYKKLLDLSVKEKDLIIYEDLKSLTQTIMDKEEIMNMISVEKDSLKEKMVLLKAEFGYAADENIPVIRLINLFPEEWKLKFEIIFTRLKEYTSSIRTLSMINKKLISDTMKFINYVVDFLKKGDGEVEMYSAKGGMIKKSNELSFLDVQL